MVRVWPLGPLNVYPVASLDSHMALGIGRVLVTDNVGRAVIICRNEAIARVRSRPGGHGRGVGHIREGVDVEAFVIDAINNDIGDMAMCSNLGGR